MVVSDVDADTGVDDIVTPDPQLSLSALLLDLDNIDDAAVAPLRVVSAKVGAENV